jgi:cytochrome c oxidase cbb3-type subunit 2
MELFNNHRKLFSTAFWFFAGLTFFVAILPAINNQENNAPLPEAIPLSKEAEAGKKVFIDNGCVACHTQQVRNVEMDKVWGQRPSMAADYAANTRTDFWRNTATLMGTERTGPDLTNVGTRQSSSLWNLLHLYQPRSLVEKSVMPAYPWLFEIKDSLQNGDVEVMVPDKFRQHVKGKIVASQDALNLDAYLLSLKQTPLPDGTIPVEFLYKQPAKAKSDSTNNIEDGKALYVSNCQSCHQSNGEGLKGAFPPLKGSAVVLDDNVETYVTIIMNGYDARPEYGVMPAVGRNNNLTPEQVTAIINHERTTWGNNAKFVSQEDVIKIIDFLIATSNNEGN